MLKIPNDIVFFIEAPEHWVAYNVFTRTSLGMDAKALEIIGTIGKLSERDLEGLWKGQMVRIWEIEYFSNLEGLLADPTRRLRGKETWPEPREVDAAQLLQILKDHWIIIENESDYRNRFNLKESILDRNNFGNFHQQLGQELFFKRKNPGDWWTKQKFSDDLQSLRNNLYSAVQGSYLDKFFSDKLRKGYKVIDIGCGTGYYSNSMARLKTDVLGVDPNEDHINIAKSHALPGSTFQVCPIGKEGSFDFLEANSFDVAFMSDALLFYFVSPESKPAGDINLLFREIKRILKPEGSFFNMEPHYTFWLAPWLGDIYHPFTVLTEYKNRNFLVTPSYAELIKSYTDGGFSIAGMEELYPQDDLKDLDSRGYHFAKQFPLWQIFHLIPNK